MTLYYKKGVNQRYFKKVVCPKTLSARYHLLNWPWVSTLAIKKWNEDLQRNIPLLSSDDLLLKCNTIFLTHLERLKSFECLSSERWWVVINTSFLRWVLHTRWSQPLHSSSSTPLITTLIFKLVKQDCTYYTPHCRDSTLTKIQKANLRSVKLTFATKNLP